MIYKKERAFPQLITVFSLIIFLIFIANTVSNYIQHYGHGPIPLPFPPGVGAITAPNGELIGVSNGNIAFDVKRPSGVLKKQASIQLENGNGSNADADWLEALSLDSGDAEALIYLEDQRVLTSGLPYVTFVVATMLSGSNSILSVGRDNLQGAYVAQKEYNDGLKSLGSKQVRLLIANSGSEITYVTSVAQQIVSIAKQDNSVVGVLGWPFSGYTQNVMHIFSAAHIPILSPTASSDLLTGISPYFFRVVPANKTQGIQGANYALQTLKAKSAIIFVDPQNTYSQSLAKDFSDAYQAGGGSVIKEEDYTVGKPTTIPDLLQDALSHSPQMIYFSGYSIDVSTLLINLPPGTLPVLGGDALYELGGYANSSRAAIAHLNFTSFVYPDEWDVFGYSAKKPNFFAEYIADFDPNGVHATLSGGGPYGYDRADSDTILSYDGMVALIKGYNNALNTEKQKVTPGDLLKGLQHISGTNGFQGVSGYIAFDTQGNPVDKSIVILYVDQKGFFQMRPTVLGHFLQ